MTFSIIQKSQLERALRLDAEYFQPRYLNIEDSVRITKKFKHWGDIEGKFITGPFGSEFNVENYVSNGKFRYIRGKDVKNFFLEDNDNVYVPEKDFDRLKKYSLAVGDILISVVGTNGNTIIIDKNNVPSIFSCKSTTFRGKINPYYLITFLNCRYGQQQLERNARGAIQTGLNIDDLRSVLIYIPTEKSQLEISNSVKESKSELENSKYLYQKAENLLFRELGLENFASEQKLFSIVNLSDCQKANRIDPDFFQSIFLDYENILTKFNTKRLENLCSLISYGTVPTSPYYNSGIPYVKGMNLKECFIDHSKIDHLELNSTLKLPEKFRLKKDDIVISQMGTVGNAAIAEKEENDWLFASFTIRVRASEESKKILNPLYLTFYINKIAKPFYLMRYIAQASVRQNTDLPTIKNLPVPTLPISIQQRIADLVRKSHESHKKSKDLLEEAKRKVEEMIEGKNARL